MVNAPELFVNVSSSIKNILCATGNLNTSIEAFAAVAQKLEKKCKELEEKEKFLKEMEKSLLRGHGELEKKEIEYRKREKELLRRENEVTQREVEAERKKSENFSHYGENITLNVGGTKFTTTKTTLLKFKGSYFETLLESGSPHHNGDELEFFIDRSPQHFSAVLNFIRDGKIQDENLKPNEIDDLSLEFDYYRITSPLRRERLPRIESPRFDTGSMLSHLMQEVLSTWIPKRRFVLLYKATRDGFTSDDFHNKCDKQGPTLTLIQSKEGYIFGGFSQESFESITKWKTHPNTFIFSLSNPHSLPPTKFILKKDNPYAILCCPSPNKFSFAFGGGSDIIVCSDSHVQNYSFFKFPFSFVDTTGKGKKLFTGSDTFTTRDIEVYCTIPI